MNLDMDFESIERAGQEVNAFNEVSHEGGDVAQKLATVIESLKNNWVGSDATVHINNLISLHETLYDVCKYSVEVSAAAVTSIYNTQGAIEANGGNARTCKMPQFETIEGVREIARATATEAYKPKDGANEDYNSLGEVKQRFLQFVDEYNSKYNVLTSNWRDGGGIETLREVHSKLNNNFNQFQEFIESALKNLRTALDNIGSVNSQN